MEFTIFYETIALVYLSVCLRFCSFINEPKCEINPKTSSISFVTWILWPVVAIRTLGYFKLKDSNYTTLNDFTFYLNLYWNFAYGLWTVINMGHILNAKDPDMYCEINRSSLTELNYEVTIIFGVFPALVSMFFVLIAVMMAPYAVWLFYRNR